MKRTILTVATLALLAVTPALVRAADTNSPSSSTNAVVKPYPLDYCLVSGDKIGGDMGKPIIIVYKGQEMKFCCSDCPPKFKKNPEKYMKMLDEAEKKAAAKTESK
jgi:YHS domain-containing protein